MSKMFAFFVYAILAASYPVINTEENVIDSSEAGLRTVHGQKETTCDCGWVNKGRQRIIHGSEASPNEFPWIVAVRTYFGPDAHINCSGTLITHHHVLTAAHCLVKMYVDMSSAKPEDIHLFVGVHNFDQLTPKNTVREYLGSKHFIRKEFFTEYTKDIAIVFVEEQIAYSQFVGPICLSPTRIAEPKQQITIIGWGITENRSTSPVLLKAKTSVIDRKKCDIYKHEICTRADKSATCTGDSGGPLSWLDPETNRYTLMSIVSYGDPNCVSTPSVSTDIAFFYKWIQDTIAATSPEEYTCTKKIA